MTTENTDSNFLPPLAFFIPGLNGGGAQRVFVTLVNTLVNMTDHPIHLVTSRGAGAFENLVDQRVRRVVLGHHNVSRSLLSLARYIREERPLAMVSTLDYCNVVFLMSTLFARVPLRKIIREANVLPEEYASARERYRVQTLRALMRLVYRRADHVIIITEDVQLSLLKHRIVSSERMTRIPNPLAPPDQGVRPDRFLGCSTRRFILAIGRLSYQKGFDILIKAFQHLSNEKLDLVILGDGPLRHDLQCLANSLGVGRRVHMPGFVQSTEQFLHNASLFVLSSRWEGFSNVLLEALAAGTPIVATDCPGSSRELLQEGRLGRLVTGREPKELADAMQKELNSESSTRTARKARAAEFSPERIAKMYLRIMTADVALPG